MGDRARAAGPLVAGPNVAGPRASDSVRAPRAPLEPLQVLAEGLWDGEPVPFGAELVVTTHLDLVGGIGTLVVYLPDPDDFTLWPALEPGTRGRARFLWPRRHPAEFLIIELITGPHAPSLVQVPIGVPGRDTLAAWVRA
jgi:hypothetical protein